MTPQSSTIKSREASLRIGPSVIPTLIALLSTCVNMFSSILMSLSESLPSGPVYLFHTRVFFFSSKELDCSCACVHESTDRPASEAAGERRSWWTTPASTTSALTPTRAATTAPGRRTTCRDRLPQTRRGLHPLAPGWERRRRRLRVRVALGRR